MLTRAIATIIRPFSRLLLRTLPARDPWDRIPCPVPLRVYGIGARRDFKWYFEGKSSVDVSSVDEIIQFLSKCTYVRDPDLFVESDYWQHPCTFEQLRRGDCEDFALWAWRKLIELGFEAEFVAGRLLLTQKDVVGHTWVLYRDENNVYLLDPVIRHPARMIRPLGDVQKAYLPEVSVDGTFTRYAYGAYLKHRNLAQRFSSRSSYDIGAFEYELAARSLRLESSVNQ